MKGRGPLILGKKQKIAEGRKTSKASNPPSPNPPLHLAQGLDPLLVYRQVWNKVFEFWSDHINRMSNFWSGHTCKSGKCFGRQATHSYPIFLPKEFLKNTSTKIYKNDIVSSLMLFHTCSFTSTVKCPEEVTFVKQSGWCVAAHDNHLELYLKHLFF